MSNRAFKAVNQYQTADNSSIEYADPHELILRLMNGAIERIAQAKGAIQYRDVQHKGEYLGKAISIIGGLEGWRAGGLEGWRDASIIHNPVGCPRTFPVSTST